LFQFLNHRRNPVFPSADAKGTITKYFSFFWKRQATYGGISLHTANILTLKEIMQAIKGVTLICIYQKKKEERKESKTKEKTLILSLTTVTKLNYPLTRCAATQSSFISRVNGFALDFLKDEDGESQKLMVLIFVCFVPSLLSTLDDVKNLCCHLSIR
jgi:hypothetical protein